MNPTTRRRGTIAAMPVPNWETRPQRSPIIARHLNGSRPTRSPYIDVGLLTPSLASGSGRSDSSKVIELSPGHPDPWFQRGRARAKLGQADEAIADCVKGPQVSPEHVPGCVDLWLLHEQSGDWTDAQASSPK